jgi:membrane-bound lytic murein transglycosylase D
MCAPEPPVPPPPPVSPPVRHRVRVDEDTRLWLRRLPADPPPQAVRLAPRLKGAFTREGVSPALIWLAEVESSFNPQARSPVGAAGLYQFMPATAERFGLALAPTDQRLDPERSAQAAARYLRYLYGRFDDWALALAAYNAGEGRVGRTLQRHGGRSFEDIAPHLPLETRMYVPRVLAVVERREGLNITAIPPPAPPPTGSTSRCVA